MNRKRISRRRRISDTKESKQIEGERNKNNGKSREKRNKNKLT